MRNYCNNPTYDSSQFLSTMFMWACRFGYGVPVPSSCCNSSGSCGPCSFGCSSGCSRCCCSCCGLFPNACFGSCCESCMDPACCCCCRCMPRCAPNCC